MNVNELEYEAISFVRACLSSKINRGNETETGDTPTKKGRP